MQSLGKVDRMEEELKCPVCHRLYTNPVFLPCSHSLCMACAVNIQAPAQQFQTNPVPPEDTNANGSEYDYPELDKLSLVSETDSGVVCNSRPSSYVGTPSIGSWLFHSIQGSTHGISCPECKRVVFLDDPGASLLPKNRVLENIVDKYGENKQYVIQCQLCEGESATAATQMCEQCEVFYCDTCREGCHPARGPLAKHNLVSPGDGKTLLRAKHKSKESKCIEHADENLSMYCVMCKTIVCYICVQDGRHINHDVQALGAMCKAQKTELSQLLQTLSEKARVGTEFIQRLKCMADKVQENCVEFEASVVAQCDALVDAIKLRKQQLLESIQQERDDKQCIFKEQASQCTTRLQKTTALLQFSIEVLKEGDPSAFLQVSSSLINRVTTLEKSFNKEMAFEPRVAPDFELCLDNHSVLHSIQTLNFFQMKDGIVGKSKAVRIVRIKRRKPAPDLKGETSSSKDDKNPPGPPQIVPEDCSAENNTVTIAWQPHTGSHVDGYVLELDDGNEGDFREVYCGKETICTVEGLHFDSMYNARVKAFNHAGDSDYSQCVCLQTAEVAWFNLDPVNTHKECVFSNNDMTVTCNSMDDRVVLANVGFSKGIHYWEVHFDRYDNQPDPAIGVARFDVAKDKMLGKDDKGWSMYVDYNRSWFMHNGVHTDRTDGGVTVGSVVGVLLDLNQHTLSFYINGEPHGPIGFTGLHGVYYPALSLNRNVQVTVHAGLGIPLDSDTEDE